MYDYNKAIELLKLANNLLAISNDGAFKNGVTDSSGTDEGDVYAAKAMDEIQSYLRDVVLKEKPLLNVGDTAYYLLENRVHSAPVLCRSIVENAHDEYAGTQQQKGAWQTFGRSSIDYRTCHGIINHEEAFHSKHALMEHIRDTI